MCKNATDLRSDLTNLKTGNADIVVKSWRTDELFPRGYFPLTNAFAGLMCYFVVLRKFMILFFFCARFTELKDIICYKWSEI